MKDGLKEFVLVEAIFTIATAFCGFLGIWSAFAGLAFLSVVTPLWVIAAIQVAWFIEENPK